MADDLTRRRFLGTAGAAAALAAGAPLAAGNPASETAPEKLQIIAVACSPRKGKTTAAGLSVCLEAARAVSVERIDTELIELADLQIPAALAAGLPLEAGQQDDFPQVASRLTDARVAGIIIGTPVYFGNMSALCKAFLDRCIELRKNNFALSGKVAGVLAVGGARNGGQELTIRSVQTALMCQEMIIVGDGRPTGHFGATLWNPGTDDISPQPGPARGRSGPGTGGQIEHGEQARARVVGGRGARTGSTG